MTENTLRELIREGLENARENGYTFEGWTAEMIAEDMERFYSEVEDCSQDSILPHIQEWLDERDAVAAE